jgi:hypothetical protein
MIAFSPTDEQWALCELAHESRRSPPARSTSRPKGWVTSPAAALAAGFPTTCPRTRVSRFLRVIADGDGQLEPDDLKRHGFSSTKVRTIIDTAHAVVADDLHPGGPSTARRCRGYRGLTNVRGIAAGRRSRCCSAPWDRLHVPCGDDVGAHNKLRDLFGIDT